MIAENAVIDARIHPRIAASITNYRNHGAIGSSKLLEQVSYVRAEVGKLLLGCRH
jgi:hypothetical protein